MFLWAFVAQFQETCHARGRKRQNGDVSARVMQYLKIEQHARRWRKNGRELRYVRSS